MDSNEEEDDEELALFDELKPDDEHLYHRTKVNEAEH